MQMKHEYQVQLAGFLPGLAGQFLRSGLFLILYNFYGFGTFFVHLSGSPNNVLQASHRQYRKNYKVYGFSARVIHSELQSFIKICNMYIFFHVAQITRILRRKQNQKDKMMVNEITLLKLLIRSQFRFYSITFWFSLHFMLRSKNRAWK